MSIESEFVEMIKSHEGTIYKIIYSYTRDRHEIMDLYQEAVYQLWKSFPKFMAKSSINTWLYRVVLNTALTHQRSENRRKNKINEASLVDFNYSYNHELDIKIKQLYDAIHTLPKIDRAVILLVLEGSSHKQISQILGITPTNVGTKISRIKQKLLSILNMYEDENG